MRDILQDLGGDDVRDAAANRARREQLMSRLPDRITVRSDLSIVKGRYLTMLIYNLLMLAVVIVALVVAF